MKNALVLSLCLLAAACTAPTLQQRQEAWRRHMTVQQATCVVGSADVAMPEDVRVWCTRVGAP